MKASDGPGGTWADPAAHYTGKEVNDLIRGAYRDGLKVAHERTTRLVTVVSCFAVAGVILGLAWVIYLASGRAPSHEFVDYEGRTCVVLDTPAGEVAGNTALRRTYCPPEESTR